MERELDHPEIQSILDNYPWRAATRDELFHYYETEFPRTPDAFPVHIGVERPHEYAISFGDQQYPTQNAGKREFIRRNTRRGDRDRGRGEPVFDDFDDVADFFAHPGYNDPLQDQNSDSALLDPDIADEPQPAPHAVYARLTYSTLPWVLAFDVDAKDVALRQARRSVDDPDKYSNRELLEHRQFIQLPPEGYKYTLEHVELAIKICFNIKEHLEQVFNFDDLMVMYSGQGAHVYGFDADTHHTYGEQPRQVLVRYFRDVQDLPIDHVVSTTPDRVMRMPYTLHGDVCRVPTPITDPDFDFLREAAPEFLRTR